MIEELSFPAKMLIANSGYPIKLEETQLETFFILLSAWVLFWIIIFVLDKRQTRSL